MKLLVLLTFFSPCIESGPSFLAIKKYWKKFNKNIKKLQESSSIDIPFLHIVGLKLILLADLSHFSSVKKARQFLVDEREDRKRDSIISQYKIFIGKIFIYEHCNIKDILRKSLNYNYKKIRSIEELKKTIPFFSCRGVFGINGLLYAYFNELLIQSYPVIGNDQAHNGKWGSFSRHVQFFPNDPDATGSLFKEEKFLSSVLFAEHDRKHNDSIRYNHKQSHALYLPFYEKFSFDPANKVQSFLQLITLFFVVYEVPHIISIKGFKNMLTMIFREYDYYKGPESYRQLIALKDIDDFKQLIVASGVAVQFNEDEPWKNGPMVREVLLPVYKDMYNFFYN
jgi:hypothetical protein